MRSFIFAFSLFFHTVNLYSTNIEPQQQEKGSDQIDDAHSRDALHIIEDHSNNSICVQTLEAFSNPGITENLNAMFNLPYWQEQENKNALIELLKTIKLAEGYSEDSLVFNEETNSFNTNGVKPLGANFTQRICENGTAVFLLDRILNNYYIVWRRSEKKLNSLSGQIANLREKINLYSYSTGTRAMGELAEFIEGKGSLNNQLKQLEKEHKTINTNHAPHADRLALELHAGMNIFAYMLKEVPEKSFYISRDKNLKDMPFSYRSTPTKESMQNSWSEKREGLNRYWSEIYSP